MPRCVPLNRVSAHLTSFPKVNSVQLVVLVVVGKLVCLALWPIAAGAAGTLKVLHRGEVVEVTTDEALGETAAGTALYVTSAGLVSATETGNTLVGCAAAAIGAADKTFEIVCA